MKQITLNKVGHAYDTEWTLEDLNLTMQQGDRCILLIGKNGTGKGTLLNVVRGSLPPNCGNLSRGGMTIRYLPYEHPLYRHLTVLGNLRYLYRCSCGKNLDVQSAVVQEVLQTLLIDYLDQYMDQCSSGQEQKAETACIPPGNADMIITDEPFVAIDAKGSEGLCELISEKCENMVFLTTGHTLSGTLPVVNQLLALGGYHLVLDTKDHRRIIRYFQPEEDAVWFAAGCLVCFATESGSI